MKIISLILSAFVFTSCSSQKIQDYQREKPKLILENYFSGTVDAYGIVQDRSEHVTKRFHVVMTANWVNNVGTLNEDFSYADGTTSNRIWTIKKMSENKYIGTASDVVGEAVGECSGNAFHWKYILDVPVGEKNYHINVDDWMYLVDEKILLNRSNMTKFGIDVGEVTLSFSKRAP